MKLIKYLVYCVVTLVVLLVSVFFGVIAFVDPNNYKPQIEALVKSNAHINLTIDGQIRWKFYPWVGLAIDNTSIASMEIPDHPVAKLEKFEAYLHLIPLLKGDMEISDIRIDGLAIHLLTDKNGMTNWKNIGASSDGMIDNQNDCDAACASGMITYTKGGPPPTERKLEIQSITIYNSHVLYENQMQNQVITAGLINIKTGTIKKNTPFNVTFNATVTDQSIKANAAINATASITYDLIKKKYAIHNLQLTNRLAGNLFSNKDVHMELTGDVLADLKSGQIDWSQFRLKANELVVQGAIGVRNLRMNQPEINLKLESNTFNPKKLLSELGVSLPEPAHKKALSSAQIKTNIAFTEESLIMRSATIMLDQNRFSIDLIVKDFKKPVIEGVISSAESFNVDHYLPESEKKGPSISAGASGNTPAPSNDKAGHGIWSTVPITFPNILNHISGQFNITLKELIVNNLPVEKFTMQISAKNGVLDLKTLQGQLFSGQVQLTGQADLRGKSIKASLKPVVANLPINKVLAAISGQLPLEGNINLKGQIKTQGISQAEWVRNLSGNVNFDIGKGLIRNINYENEMCKGFALINREALTTEFKNKDTHFEKLAASAVINKGVLSNQDLAIVIPGFIVHGKGTLDLNQLKVLYNLGVTITGDQINQDPACRVNKQFANFPVPIKCAGSVVNGASGLCALDQNAVAAIVKQLGEEKLKKEINKKLDKEVNKQLDKLGDKLDKKLGDKAPEVKELLEGLFKK